MCCERAKTFRDLQPQIKTGLMGLCVCNKDTDSGVCAPEMTATQITQTKDLARPKPSTQKEALPVCWKHEMKCHICEG